MEKVGRRKGHAYKFKNTALVYRTSFCGSRHDLDGGFAWPRQRRGRGTDDQSVFGTCRVGNPSVGARAGSVVQIGSSGFQPFTGRRVACGPVGDDAETGDAGAI